jgi:type III restriction enzyme
VPTGSSAEEEQREIVFKDITTGEITHTTILDTAGVADYRSVIGYFAQTIMKDLRLVSGYDVLYGKVKAFVRKALRPALTWKARTRCATVGTGGDQDVIETFKKAINALTVRDKGDAEIVKSFTKNFFAVGFKLDYVKADGDISTYTPDFIVKADDGNIWIIETKGREELDLPMKMARLKQWCEDLNRIQSLLTYQFLYIPQEEYERSSPRTFSDLQAIFREFQ